MYKKTFSLAMCLAVVAVGACFASDAAPAAIVLNGISHTVWVGKGASDSTVVIDSADDPVPGVVNCSLAATFTRLAALKNFVITLVPSDEFAPSGEVTLKFPKRDSLRLYGKVSEKTGAKGAKEYSLAFFAGLTELRDCCLLGRSGASLSIFSQDGQRRDIALPGAFFEAMPNIPSR